jgi:aspartokinase/homoserine dehydrogenase 1
MRVLKFGGSSIASPERIRDVTNIILSAIKEEPVIVVVSAFKGISNELLHCAKLAAAGDTSFEVSIKIITERHLNAIQALLPEKNNLTINKVQELINELNELLQSILLLRELTLGATDHIASFGERLSATIIAAYINQHYPAEYVDSRQLIFTDEKHTHANVHFDKTNFAIKEYYDDCQRRFPLIPIMTGFIASSIEGRTTTLGRNSSDYSATIVGAALDASRVEIWTDVDGIYSADPQFVPTAFIVPHLSFDEAIELSYFGAKVLHTSTFIPVVGKEIPILIKNTLNPTSPGTLISKKENRVREKKWIAKSITAIDDITLLIWRGHGEIDVSATIERLFKSLTSESINIFLVLEGSPKHTICLAISHHEMDRARAAIQREFHLELQHQLVSIEEKPSQSIIAIIGDEMKMLSPDIAGKMFQALGKVQININAIIQGASEHNVSLVIDSHQRTHALNLIHQSFFSEFKCLSLVVIGAGRVGTGLLQQIYKQQKVLLDKKIKLSICAITNSRKIIFDANGIDLSNWQIPLENATTPFDIKVLLEQLSDIKNTNVALVDCTASDATVDAYPLFIEKGMHIITPNKRANVLPLPQWTLLMNLFEQHHCYFLCRTNVGAGLPILTVLEDLLACGDSIIKIEGILSGTLSYLFNHYDGSISFSDVLKQAQVLAMTEPDPREDLSGIDVARKLLVLARKMGWPMELSDVKVQNLVPPSLQSGPYTDQFFDHFKQFEPDFKERLLQSQQEKKVLRYIGTLANHKASASLQAIPLDHPLALSVHSDNIISFTTHHYHDAPLVIRGPGAGVECTALGVFSDILKLLSKLPNI